VRICTDAAAGAGSEKTYHQYLAVLSQQGVLASDAATERFFRVMLDLCVQSCAATSKPHGGPEPGSAASSLPSPRTRLLYTGVDALSKLVVLLVKVSVFDGRCAGLRRLRWLQIPPPFHCCRLRMVWLQRWRSCNGFLRSLRALSCETPRTRAPEARQISSHRPMGSRVSTRGLTCACCPIYCES
jgi:hypothetical protein